MALLDKLKFVARQYANKPIVTVYTLNIVMPQAVSTMGDGASLPKIKTWMPYNHSPREVMDYYNDLATHYANLAKPRSTRVSDIETVAWLLGYVGNFLAEPDPDALFYAADWLGRAEWLTPLVPWIAKEINAWVRAGTPHMIEPEMRQALLEQYVTEEQVANHISFWQHPLGRFEHLREIADWVTATRPNIMGMSLVEADEKQWAWHQAEAEKARRQQAEDVKLDPPKFTAGDYAFHELTKKAQLKAEGCEQGICVGRSDMPYWRGVQEGTTKIYSVREGDRIVATIEVKTPVYASSYVARQAKFAGTIVQVKGRFNQNVTNYDEIEAIGAFAQALRYDSAVEPWHSWLRGARPAHRQHVAGLHGFVSGFGRTARRALR